MTHESEPTSLAEVREFMGSCHDALTEVGSCYFALANSRLMARPKPERHGNDCPCERGEPDERDEREHRQREIRDGEEDERPKDDDDRRQGIPVHQPHAYLLDWR